jgi:hypothetical protein
MLVDPSGNRNLVVMTAVGGASPLNNATITLEDMAPSYMPQGSALAAGQNYRPTACLPDTQFTAPAPAEPHTVAGCGTTDRSTFADVFSGFNPNGAWNLYVMDEQDPDGTQQGIGTISSGSIGGWGIQFLAPTAAPASISGRLVTASGDGVRNAAVTISGGGLDHPITTYTGTFGYYSFEGLQTGTTYIVSVRPKRYVIANPVRAVTLTDNVAGLDFVAEPIE